MPDLSNSPEVLQSVAFLYHSVEDALGGKEFGGSGVIVSLPLTHRPDLSVSVAITNWHVAVQDGASVLRYTGVDGKTHIEDADPSEWTFIPGGPDIAAKVVNGPSPIAIPVSIFLTAKDDLFLGEDVLMAGRFIDYDGGQSNHVALRFGALSMISVPIPQPTGYRGLSHDCDMRSRTGFSGSPVYAYRSHGTVRNARVGALYSGLTIGPGQPRLSQRNWGDGTQMIVKLIGLHWGQFPESLKATTKGGAPSDLFVKGMSGMTQIIPVEEIHRLLDAPPFKTIVDLAPEKLERYAAPEG